MEVVVYDDKVSIVIKYVAGGAGILAPESESENLIEHLQQDAFLEIWLTQRLR